eukprot:1882192-Rhodomonas_salina.1
MAYITRYVGRDVGYVTRCISLGVRGRGLAVHPRISVLVNTIVAAAGLSSSLPPFLPVRDDG